MFSCITTTFRYGGVDILTESLSCQLYEDFECIFVDELYDERKEVVEDYLKQYDVWNKVIHIPPKERKEKRRIGMQNGRNTALLLAEGDYAVQLDDYTMLQPDALSRFDQLHTQHPNDVLLGIRRTYSPPKITNEEGLISTYEEPLRSLDGLQYDSYPVVAESQGIVEIDRMVWVLNLGCIPLDPLVEFGGYDERYDDGHGHDDVDMMYRMFFIGKDAWMDTNNINAHIRHPNQSTPGTGNNIKHLDNRFENERVEAVNNYDFQELRSKFLQHKPALKEGKQVESLPLEW